MLLDTFDSSITLENCYDISPHFDLGLDDKGLRIGHWNVNRLSSEKFDQIKLFLIGKSGRAQVDTLFLAETFLKPDIPDVLYAVPGFSIYWHDKKARNKAVGMLRNIKRKFYVSKLEQNETDAKGRWKIINSISGMVKQSKRVNSLWIEDRIIEDTFQMASEFNSPFSSVADKLRSLLPQTNFDMSKLINFVRSKKDNNNT